MGEIIRLPLPSAVTPAVQDVEVSRARGNLQWLTLRIARSIGLERTRAALAAQLKLVEDAIETQKSE